MPSPTIIRFCKRNNRVGLVIDNGEFHFQVYDINDDGTTHLIYTCPYEHFDNHDYDRMGALDHWLIFEERGNF